MVWVDAFLDLTIILMRCIVVQLFSILVSWPLLTLVLMSRESIASYFRLRSLSIGVSRTSTI